MSVYHNYSVKCGCGETLEVPLADGVNVTRTPDARKEILRGEFHRYSCQACGAEGIVEKEFFYTDFENNCFIKVMPRQDRHQWQRASKTLDAETDQVPEALSAASRRTLRVVFGLGELREKLVSQDAQLDDRVVEILKVLAIYEHPFLVQRPRLRLLLDKVSDETIDFVACFDHQNDRFRVRIPRRNGDDLAGRPEELEGWLSRAHGSESLFRLRNDYWINFWRWSPQTKALSLLADYAAQARRMEYLPQDSKLFEFMLNYLPRGNHLPSWAKGGLRDLFVYAKARKDGKLQDELFEIHFGIGLDDDWHKNDDPDDIDTLWKLLRDLPDTHIEGSTEIRDLNLAGGTSGRYEPSTNDIYIGGGLLSERELFESQVRHEVGHAVHEQFRAKIDPWLTKRFGWQEFGTADLDIDAWVDLMGGWGDLSATQRSNVRCYLREALGPGKSWRPGPAPNPSADDPWWRTPFGPRSAYEKTGADWWKNRANWHRHGGRAFFMNFQYRKFMVVDEKTLDLIGKMPRRYAAMSKHEFFAELYALYYDLDDDLHSNLPTDVKEWLDTNIGTSGSMHP